MAEALNKSEKVTTEKSRKNDTPDSVFKIETADPLNTEEGQQLIQALNSSDESTDDLYMSDDSDVGVGGDGRRILNSVMLMLILIVLILALVISIRLFQFGRNKEIDDFESHFIAHANKAISLIESVTARSMRAIDSFSAQITTDAIERGETWPYVVLPDFESRARLAIDVAQTVSCMFVPIVANETHRRPWEFFSFQNQDWLSRSLSEQRFIDRYDNDFYQEPHDNNTTIEKDGRAFFSDDESQIRSEIFKIEGASFPRDDGPAPYAPLWQFAPALPLWNIINFNLLSIPYSYQEIMSVIQTERTIIGKAVDSTQEVSKDFESSLWLEAINLFLDQREELDDNHNNVWRHNLWKHNHSDSNASRKDGGGPVSVLYAPIFDRFDSNDRKVVGILVSYVYWQKFFENILPDDVDGMHLVMENSCNQSFTYKIDGGRAMYVGEDTLPESKYEHLEIFTEFGEIFLQANDDPNVQGQCLVKIHLYPTYEMELSYHTRTPLIFTIILISTFLITSLIFIWYPFMISRHNKGVIDAAIKSSAIVQSIFPAHVRDRMFKDDLKDDPVAKKIGVKSIDKLTSSGQPYSLADCENQEGLLTSDVIFGSKPIADLFPNTTIMFADMVGFTAWSSVREPSQVFMLLETVYHSFDMIARKMGVFKVETVGDCYVAVCGLPNPRQDHAVVMAQFAWNCLEKMKQLSHALETRLGPDTGDVGLRIGLHSGPVTAGVLRGFKGRFQLFGDTVNTASRIENTGMSGMVHLSRETTDLIINAGKSDWIVPRNDDIVVTKGKAELQTYWLQITPVAMECSSSSSESSLLLDTAEIPSPETKPTTDISGKDENVGTNTLAIDLNLPEKTIRLIRWNVEVLSKLLQQVMARRASISGPKDDLLGEPLLPRLQSKPGKTIIDEVKDIIMLPPFDSEAFQKQVDPVSIELPAAAIEQLNNFVTEIANMYRSNPFHNFDHASHVAMSVTKLLSRIVNPSEMTVGNVADPKIAANLHDQTYGIGSDPLTQFACVFAALVHDVDHQGISNSILIQEKQPIAEKYSERSIAEQNSIDIAWNLLMDKKYEDLCKCIYSDHKELKRFRQLVVNIVMATDILDKELGLRRKERWERAFESGDAKSGSVSSLSEESSNNEMNIAGNETIDSRQKNINRKATIVVEYLLQASDVAHSMQHWHVYIKWTERLFHEVFGAYRMGRINDDPSQYWYEGELAFFDYYILPLARKLERCGVFGVACDEFINYALANRREWADRGKAIITEFLANHFQMEEDNKKDESMSQEFGTPVMDESFSSVPSFNNIDGSMAKQELTMTENIKIELQNQNKMDFNVLSQLNSGAAIKMEDDVNIDDSLARRVRQFQNSGEEKLVEDSAFIDSNSIHKTASHDNSISLMGDSSISQRGKALNDASISKKLQQIDDSIRDTKLSGPSKSLEPDEENEAKDERFYASFSERVQELNETLNDIMIENDKVDEALARHQIDKKEHFIKEEKAELFVNEDSMKGETADVFINEE